MDKQILLDESTNALASFLEYDGFATVEDALLRSNLYDHWNRKGDTVIPARHSFLFAHFLDMWYLVALSSTGFACIGKNTNVYLLDGIIHKERYSCDIKGYDDEGKPMAALPYIFTEKTTHIIFPNRLYQILLDVFPEVAVFEYQPDCHLKDVTNTTYGQTHLSILFATMLSMQVEPFAFPFTSFLPDKLAMTLHCIKKEDNRIETIDPFNCEAKLQNGMTIKKAMYYVKEPITSMYPFISPNMDDHYGEPVYDFFPTRPMEHKVYSNIIDLAERRGNK